MNNIDIINTLNNLKDAGYESPQLRFGLKFNDTALSVTLVGFHNGKRCYSEKSLTIVELRDMRIDPVPILVGGILIEMEGRIAKVKR